LAAGDEIAANLKRFAQERKDIFPNQQAAPKVIWDG
jgi:hypothetical protein